jgi:aminopeptidase YwaD
MLTRCFIAFVVLSSSAAAQQRPPLLAEPVVAAIAKELSGERAHETIRAISANHRVRGSRPYRAAADYIIARARASGLDSARVEEFPADGKIFYGTQRSRPAWDAEFAELWETGGGRRRLVASWDKQPMSLAEDSESGDVTAELVDVGPGASEKDYAGKNVRGKLILVSSQADAVVPLGIAKHGAAGIISSAQNQHTAWWGENTDLVRWGHLDTFSPTKTFSFMVSPRVAKSFKDRLARGERITMQAKVKAGLHPGAYSVATAMIRGSDPTLSQEEIVFSCHLDHPNPGANDNASGCATILEVGVTLSKLIKEGRIPRPLRTIRFVWPPEVEGTMAILNAKPEWAKRVKAVVHMDMVGAGLESKSVFHVSGGPGSLPSFVYDIAQTFGAWVNHETYRYAATGESKYPLVSPKGGKEPLLAQLDEFDMGSDHEVYSDASWRIPAIYLHDWPDRYIHTTWDTPERIDPTKLLRAAFIGAASGYFLASMKPSDLNEVVRATDAGKFRRMARYLERMKDIDTSEVATYLEYSEAYEGAVAASTRDFVPGRVNGTAGGLWIRTTPQDAPYDTVYCRKSEPRGPVSVFGYDYLQDKLGADRVSRLKLLEYQGLRGAGGDYAYEILNFTKYGRNPVDIRNAVSAIYGPVPIEIVVEYLRALKDAGLVTLACPERSEVVNQVQ